MFGWREPRRLRGLFTGRAGRLLILLTVGLTVLKITRYLLPLLLPSIIDDLSITPVEAGVALTVLNVFFALQQFPSGRLSDQLSRKTVLFASLGLTALGCLVLAVARGYGAFLLGVAIFGTGGGLYVPATRAWLTELFTTRRGAAFGFHLASVDFAGIAASGLAIAILSVTVWRLAFLPIALSLVAVLVAVHLFSDERIVVSRIDLEVREAVVRVFRSGRVRWLIVGLSLYMITVQGLTGFLPTYLQTEVRLSSERASMAFALLFLVGMTVKPLLGGFSDTLPRPVVGAGGLLVSAVGVGLLVAASSLTGAVAGIVLFAGGHKGFVPVMEAYLMDGFAAESMGGDLGVVRTIYWTVGSLGTTYVGYVSSLFGYRTAFLGFVGALLCGVAIVSGLALYDRR